MKTNRIKPPKTKEWSIKLKVSLEEEQKIKMQAIKMSMGIANYIKQAALDKILVDIESPEEKSI